MIVFAQGFFLLWPVKANGKLHMADVYLLNCKCSAKLKMRSYMFNYRYNILFEEA